MCENDRAFDAFVKTWLVNLVFPLKCNVRSRVNLIISFPPDNLLNLIMFLFLVLGEMQTLAARLTSRPGRVLSQAKESLYHRPKGLDIPTILLVFTVCTARLPYDHKSIIICSCRLLDKLNYVRHPCGEALSIW